MQTSTRMMWLAGKLSLRAASTFQYCAVSTVRLADLKDAIRQLWQNYALDQDEIASGLKPWEIDVVDRFVGERAAVLLVGCGSGRDLLPLAERGCRVTGVEPASHALQVARRVLDERHLSADLVEGFFEDVPLSGRFDAVMFSYYSYSYIPVAARRVGTLSKAAAHLNDGGHVIVSYPRMKPRRPILIRLGRIAGFLSGSDWRLEPGDIIGSSHLSSTRFSYQYVHAFEEGEIDREAAKSGLRVVYRQTWSSVVVVVMAPDTVSRRDQVSDSGDARAASLTDPRR